MEFADKVKPLFLSRSNLVSGKLGKPSEDLLDNVTTDDITFREHALYTDPEMMRTTLFHGLELWGNRVLVKGEFNVLVAGNSLGIGSSRETAAEAVRLNGFKMVFARSFGPIFFNNLIFQGVIPSDDLALVKKLLEGKKLGLDELTENLSLLQKRILAAGGLPNYVRAISKGNEVLPQKKIKKRRKVTQTAVEKFISMMDSEDEQKGKMKLKAGDSVVIRANKFVGYDVFWAHSKRVIDQSYGGKLSVDPRDIWLFLDHFGGSVDKNAKDAVRLLHDFWEANPGTFRGTDGVYNKIMPLRLAVGDVVAAMDSHSPELGVVPGVLVMPIGYSAFACGVANKGLVPYTIPDSVRLKLEGELPPWCDIKDAIWNMVYKYFDGSDGNGKMFEIGGSGYEKLPYIEAAKVFNAVTEFGGVGALGVTYNQNVVDYLRKHGNDLGGMTDEAIQGYMERYKPDDTAEYTLDVVIRLDTVRPAIAGPHSHKQVRLIGDKKMDVNIDRVIFNSCAGTTILDLAILAEILSNEKRKIPVDVHLADPITRYQGEKLGILYELERSGVKIDLRHSCGPCMGQGAAVKKGERVLSTNNRNYPGRMGHSDAEVFLSSSIVASLTAKLGRVPRISEIKRAEPLIYMAKEKLGII